MKKWLAVLLALIMALGIMAFSEPAAETYEVLVEDFVAITDELIVEYGYDYYYTEEVALYLHAFRELPPNYLTKNEAYDIGWESREGNLWEVGYGLVIGGDKFGNREGLLPKEKGRQWYECDVNYEGGFRGSDRVLFSNDGLIYVTYDHYESFDLLYDGWYGDEENLYRYPDDCYTNMYYDAYYVSPYEY